MQQARYQMTEVNESQLFAIYSNFLHVNFWHWVYSVSSPVFLRHVKELCVVIAEDSSNQT